jgi:shikimate kinase
MMGVGKTTVGRKVAAKLKRAFVDGDHELEGRSGRSIADWFAHDGEPAFREAEGEVLADLLGRPAPSVIATGGGIVTLDRTRKRLAEPDALVVWLAAEPSFLFTRAKQKPGRPLLAGPDPLGTITRLAQEREPWYREVADETIDVQPVYRTQDKPKTSLAELVLERLAAHGILVP